MKIHFGYFFHEMCYPVSILAAFAQRNSVETDLCFYRSPLSYERIRSNLIETRPDLVALSFMSYSRDEAFVVANAANSLSIPVVAGGFHPSLCPEDLMQTGWFDGIVIGDGLGVFDQILREYSQLNGSIIQGYPHSDTSLYFDRYFSPTQQERIRSTGAYEIMTGFGCPFRCAFCASETTLGYRSFDLELVVDALAKASDEFGITHVYPLDDTFAVSLARVRKLRQLLNERGLFFRFSINARVSNFTEEMAEELYELGVRQIAFGVETASERLLRMLVKDATVDDNIRAVELCHKYGIEALVFLMVGLPTQTEEDYQVTLEYLRRTRPAKAFVSYFMPFPGTALFDYCLENGYMPRSWTLHKMLRQSEKLVRVNYELARHYERMFMNVVAGGEDPVRAGVHLKDLPRSLVVSQSEIRYALARIENNSKACGGPRLDG